MSKEPEKRPTSSVKRPTLQTPAMGIPAEPAAAAKRPTRQTSAVKRPTEPQTVVKKAPASVGLSLREIAMLLVIFASVTIVLLPKLEDNKRRATASEMLADVDAVRKAMYTFYSDSGYFPKSIAGGGVPDGLTRYLPSGYSSRRREWAVGYEHWTNRTKSLHVKTKLQIGVTITTPNAKLGVTAMDMYGASPKFAVGARYVFMIAGL